MPKRSNLFQEVVAVIQAHLSGDSVVTEPKMLTDIVSGEQREVDVCVEGMLGLHPVLVSIEVRDHKRKQAVGWIEEAHTKHSRLPTDKLVLISSSGFTKSALKKAATFGITTVVPDNLDPNAFGTEIVGSLESICMKTFELTAEKIRFWIAEDEHGPAEVVVALPDTLIFAADGALLTSAQILGNTMVSKVDMDNDAMREAIGDEKYFTVEMDPAHINHPDNGQPLDIYLQKEEPAGNYLRHVQRVAVTGPAKVRVAEIPLTHGELQGIGYAAGSGLLGDQDVLFVTTETSTGERRTTTRFKPGQGWQTEPPR